MKTKEQAINEIFKALEGQATTEDLKRYVSLIKWNYSQNNTYLDNYINKVLNENVNVWEVATQLMKDEIMNEWDIIDLCERIYDNITTDYELMDELNVLNIESYVDEYIENNYEEIIDNYADGVYYSDNDNVWYDVIEYEVRDIIKEKLKNIMNKL